MHFSVYKHNIILNLDFVLNLFIFYKGIKYVRCILLMVE